MARHHRRPPTRLRSRTSSSPKIFPAPTGRLVEGSGHGHGRGRPAGSWPWTSPSRAPDLPDQRHAGWLGQVLYLPVQPGSRPLYATTRSTSGASLGTGTGGSKMPLRASRSSGGYMLVMAARQASSVAGSCW
jgi:hypothetical protein